MSQIVEHISECFVKPNSYSEEFKEQPNLYLTPWDQAMLSAHYIQKGLLFAKPLELAQTTDDFMTGMLDKLKQSLSLILVHFYPLAGRLVTAINNENPVSYSIYVDSNNSPGAKFIYGTLKMTISDILTPNGHVPTVVRSFFDHNGAINHDGHTNSLLSVKVTELIDGVFIGCSTNHSVVDGTCFWNFFNMWSEIFRKNENVVTPISVPPTIKRWLPEGRNRVDIPLTYKDELITRWKVAPPSLKWRVFHFSSKSIAILKAKANELERQSSKECMFMTKISSFQSLCAFMWRSITRARDLPRGQTTRCLVIASNRARLDPPLDEYYFGNSINALVKNTTSNELVENSLGWAAMKLNQAVAEHDEKKIRQWVDDSVKSPFTYGIGHLFHPNGVSIGCSPRFNVYGNEFGMGKPLAVRSGCGYKFDGLIWAFEGHEGGGSIDLDVCLKAETLSVLEADEEFMEIAS